MTTINSFKELLVWQEAMNLVEMIYLGTQSFPKEEIYGLTSQMRRAAISIPSNIAEGYGRKSRNEYIQFLAISNGSLTELETHVLIAHRINYLDKNQLEKIQSQMQTVGRLLSALRKALTIQTV